MHDPPHAPPALLFRGRRWSSGELAAMAAGWRQRLIAGNPAAPRFWALPMANHPEAVALFFALSSLTAPVILLPAGLRGWQSNPGIPSGTRLALTPAFRRLSGAGHDLGLPVVELPDPDPAWPAEAPVYLSAPGFVFFTSGSTGLPRPVYRTRAQVMEGARTPSRLGDFPHGTGLIGSLPLDRIFGMHHTLLAATLLGRPLALLERFQHHAVLDLFGSADYCYWPATPVMADALARCTLPADAPSPHPAPQACIISGRVSASLGRRFSARFGVPLRQVYGTTETGPVAMELAPAARVHSESAGRTLPGVTIRIGDDPRAPLVPGESGRIWVSSPGSAEGYGFPPDVEPLPMVDGWWRSPDVGRIDADGQLTVLGRADDCLRTEAGHVVSPSAVADALEAYPGVVEAVVAPVDPSGAVVLGALVESAAPLVVADLRRHLARSLPAWSQPRIVAQVRTLPRLASGRPDRLACIALIQRLDDRADE